MNGSGDNQTKWSKSDRITNVWYHLNSESLKKREMQMNLSIKQKQNCRLREWIYGYNWARVGGRDRLGVWN